MKAGPAGRGVCSVDLCTFTDQQFYNLLVAAVYSCWKTIPSILILLSKSAPLFGQRCIQGWQTVQKVRKHIIGASVIQHLHTKDRTSRLLAGWCWHVLSGGVGPLPGVHTALPGNMQIPPHVSKSSHRHGSHGGSLLLVVRNGKNTTNVRICLFFSVFYYFKAFISLGLNWKWSV